MTQPPLRPAPRREQPAPALAHAGEEGRQVRTLSQVDDLDPMCLVVGGSVYQSGDLLDGPGRGVKFLRTRSSRAM